MKAEASSSLAAARSFLEASSLASPTGAIPTKCTSTSQALVHCVEAIEPTMWIELGFGSPVLAKAAYTKAKTAASASPVSNHVSYKPSGPTALCHTSGQRLSFGKSIDDSDTRLLILALPRQLYILDISASIAASSFSSGSSSALSQASDR